MVPTRGSRISVWFAQEQPTRIAYDGQHYRVSDHPTRLEEEMAVLTHPIPLAGWRFQGTGPDGVARVFDICQRGGQWELIRVYD